MVRRLASLSSSRWIKMLLDMGELYSNNGMFCTIPIFFYISNIFISRGVGGRGGFGIEPFLSALQAKGAQVFHPHFRVMMIIFLHEFLQDAWLRSTVCKSSIFLFKQSIGNAVCWYLISFYTFVAKCGKIVTASPGHKAHSGRCGTSRSSETGSDCLSLFHCYCCDCPCHSLS